MVSALFNAIDGLLKIPVKGVGFILTIALITLVGFFGSNIFVNKILRFMERVLTRLPFVKILYSSIKDLIGAFVGDKKSFDRPVLVTLFPGSNAQVVGFITRESLEFLGLMQHVAVYLPQSYNFSGNLVILPKDQVKPLDVESSQVMAFLMSGGITGGNT